MDEEKKQINVDFSKYPELYRALGELVEELDTDRSKLVRQFVRDGIEQHRAVKKLSKKAGAKIGEIAG